MTQPNLVPSSIPPINPNSNPNLHPTSDPISDPTSGSFQSLSAQEKASLISTSFSSLILSISNALKVRNQVNLLLQSHHQNQNQNLQNSSNNGIGNAIDTRSQNSTHTLKNSLDKANHSNLIRVKQDCETYLNRLRSFRDWLLHAQALLELELSKAKERESNPSLPPPDLNLDTNTSSKSNQNETITIQDSDSEEDQTSNSKGKKKKKGKGNDSKTIDLTLDDDDGDDDDDDDAKKEIGNTKGKDSETNKVDSMEVDSSLFGGDDDDDDDDDDDGEEEDSEKKKGKKENTRESEALEKSHDNQVDSSTFNPSSTSNLSNPNPNNNNIISNSTHPQTHPQAQLDFSNFDFGDLTSFADTLNQQGSSLPDNTFNLNDQGFNMNAAAGGGGSGMDLSTLDFSSFDNGFLGDTSMSLDGNFNANGAGSVGNTNTNTNANGLEGLENVDLSSIFDGFNQ